MRFVDADDLKIGEIYSINARRARLDSVTFVTGEGDDQRYRPYDASAPYVQAVFSVGRQFDRQITISGNRWYPRRVRSVCGTWKNMKDQEATQRAECLEAAELSKELKPALAKLGLSGGSVDVPLGQVVIRGDLAGMRTLAAIIVTHAEEAERNESFAALSSLLD